jgi:glutathione synthase/RimK-type ligase-like ATP-grasp enzyme
VAKRPPRVITENNTLFDLYHDLKAGDIVLGGVRLRPAEEPLLVDLVERGIRLFPAALAQLASRSKALQAKLFAPLMVPLTMAVYDLHDLTRAIALYGRNRIGRVVTKHDRRNAGMGVHLWTSIEEVYTQASFGVMPLPFVLQPFYPDCRDIRVVMIDNYEEAYWRHNPDNFRNNLHCGGASSPCELTAMQRDLCQQVMHRGRFPYAHIDIMVTADDTSYVAEINLRGGIRGAKINADEYRSRVEAVQQRWLNQELGNTRNLSGNRVPE